LTCWKSYPLFLSAVFFCLWRFYASGSIFFLIGGSAGYSLHSQWFELSRHDYDVLNYSGIAFTKICAIVFFLFPYIAVRLVLRRGKA